MDDTTFRFATIKDHDAIISFVKSHWKSDHIFVKSKTIFDWQHLDRENGRINFVLGVRESDNEILGILASLHRRNLILISTNVKSVGWRCGRCAILPRKKLEDGCGYFWKSRFSLK